MQIQPIIQQHILHRLLSTPRGRAFFFTQAADSEDSDEAAVFDALLDRVGDDPDVAKMIRRHKADEQRHAALFRAAAVATGETIAPIPASLHLIERLRRELGDFDPLRPAGDQAAPRADHDTAIMTTYLLLQVIEERAITQFSLIEPVLRQYDTEAADVLLAVANDEVRHLKYCHAISRRHAPDDATRQATLHTLREVEARVYAAHSAANLAYVLDQDIIALPRGQRPLWRLFATVAARRPRVYPTPYAAPAAAHAA